MTATTFGVVSAVEYLPRLLSDLAGLSRVHGMRTAAGDLLMSGVWVERHAGPAAVLVTPDHLAAAGLPVTIPLELSRVWALCVTDGRALGRATLLDVLVAADAGSRDGRFIPVFHHAEPLNGRLGEWRGLAARHPGLVLPPLEQGADGTITFMELVDAASPMPPGTAEPEDGAHTH